MNHKLIAAMCAGAALTFSAASAYAGEGDMMKDKFAMMDANSDGKVSSNEHEEFSEKHFKMMDKNGDGNLTMDEMKLAKEMMHKKS